MRNKTISRTCAVCGVGFLETASRVAEGRGKYCSRACANEGKKRPQRSLEERFWAKVDRRGPDECWPWTGAQCKGYGHIQEGPRGGRVLIAPRVSWMLRHGYVPDHLDVLHRCDNPPCVNPAHLFLGSHDDNMRDMAAKSRTGFRRHPEAAPRGERHGMAVFTETDVRAIRARYDAAANKRLISTQLAQEYGRDRSNIYEIATRKTWRHVA